LSSNYLANPAPLRNPAPTPGSLGDLVARALGRPIYCAPTLAVRRALMNAVVNSLRRDGSGAEFVDALGLHRNHRDWDRHWPAERERYGAAIIVTRAEDLPQDTDPFARVAGQHRIGHRLGIEIQNLVRHGRPVAWHAVVFPASYWLSRFAIEPLNQISSSRYAGLSPADAAEHFRPVIGPSWFHFVPA
jgi:hypothetical protein